MSNPKSTKTTMNQPLSVPLPLEPPRPAKGCDVCAALAEQRQAARDRGDYSLATDASVEIRNHPHRTHPHTRP
ncbi:hypothetical protein AB0M39_04735 [Streptomyces sp. NPDC051907]|uniref:hypothetical protein n=1 Tax=Streptomyces sp. NPDC051907 TaxID=3155284 RepID=UPI0034155BDA